MNSNLRSFLEPAIEYKKLLCITLQSAMFEHTITSHIYYYTVTESNEIELYVEDDDVIILYDEHDVRFEEDEMIIYDGNNRIIMSYA